MSLPQAVHEAIDDHLKEFMEWMEDGGCKLSDNDIKQTIITNLPKAPESAYQKGYNDALEFVGSAYELYLEGLE